MPRRLSSWIIRATTSLPDPVGPRISTEMSDFAAVRIHSKTTSIFSSRPIISRNRWTDRRAILVADRRRAVRGIRRAARGGRRRRAAAGRSAACRARRACATTPNVTSSRRQFSMSSRIRPNVCISASTSNDFVGSGAEEPKQSRAQRRLHQRVEPGLDLGRIRPARGARVLGRHAGRGASPVPPAAPRER